MSQNLISQIQLLACNRGTVGWVIPSGQSLAIATNTPLFESIGTEYGGNGTTSFDLPTLAPLNKVNYCCNTEEFGSDYARFAPIMGEVVLWSGMQLPEGWYMCDGQFVSNSENPALYSVIGNTFGSEGSGPEKSFAVPTIANPISNDYLRYIICGNGSQASDLVGFASSITWYAGNADSLPTGWEKCTGQTVAIRSNPTLYSLLGNTYGATEASFNYPTLPDLVPGVSTRMSIDGFYPRHI